LAKLALVDDAALVAVHELDGVFDGEDVLRARSVDLVEDRGERRGLPRACRAGHEDEAARVLRERVQDRRQAQLLERLDLLRDEAERGADRLALEVDVDAEAREPRHGVREVELPVELEVLLLLAREDAVEQRPRVVGGERLSVRARDVPAHAERGRAADRDVQIRRA
jgi:hypothetical protein